jgi:hypothetical protein
MARAGSAPTDRPPALWRRVVVRPKPMPTNLPKWLVGDWNRVIRDPLDLLRLAPLRAPAHPRRVVARSES